MVSPPFLIPVTEISQPERKESKYRSELLKGYKEKIKSIDFNYDPLASKKDLLVWLNETVGTTYRSLDNLKTGCAFLQVIELLFPRVIDPVKANTGEYMTFEERLQNYKSLQLALLEIGVEKPLFYTQMAVAEEKYGHELLQFFKEFYEANAEGLAESEAEEADIDTYDSDTTTTSNSDSDLEEVTDEGRNATQEFLDAMLNFSMALCRYDACVLAEQIAAAKLAKEQKAQWNVLRRIFWIDPHREALKERLREMETKGKQVQQASEAWEKSEVLVKMLSKDIPNVEAIKHEVKKSVDEIVKANNVRNFI